METSNQPNLSISDTAKVAVMEVKIDTIVEGNKEIKADIKALKDQFVSATQHSADMSAIHEKFTKYVAQPEFTLLKENLQAFTSRLDSLVVIFKWILGVLTTLGGGLIIYYLTHLSS